MSLESLQPGSNRHLALIRGVRLPATPKRDFSAMQRLTLCTWEPARHERVWCWSLVLTPRVTGIRQPDRRSFSLLTGILTSAWTPGSTSSSGLGKDTMR